MKVKCIDDEINNRYGQWTLGNEYEVIEEECLYFIRDDKGWTFWVGSGNFEKVI